MVCWELFVYYTPKVKHENSSWKFLPVQTVFFSGNYLSKRQVGRVLAMSLMPRLNAECVPIRIDVPSIRTGVVLSIELAFISI